MNQKLEDLLTKEQYPELFEDCWEISIDDGWFDILSNLCKGIQDYNNAMDGKIDHKDKKFEPVKFKQIKEKLGGLRIYCSPNPEFVDELVRQAEEWASITCEVCGNDGKERPTSWIKTLCIPCYVRNLEGKDKR